MNYCIVAFGIVMIISVIQWFVDGSKNYTGPKLELEAPILTAVRSPDNLKGQYHDRSPAQEKVGDESGASKASAGDLSEKDN